MDVSLSERTQIEELAKIDLICSTLLGFLVERTIFIISPFLEIS
jgi:hypothetical protein